MAPPGPAPAPAPLPGPGAAPMPGPGPGPGMGSNMGQAPQAAPTTGQAPASVPSPAPGAPPPAMGMGQPAAPAGMAAGAGMAAASPAPAGALPIDPVWLRGETPLHTLHADGLYLGPLPMQKLASLLLGFLIKLMGGHIKISLVVTEQRVLLLQSLQAFCGLNRTKMVQSLALASITESGWAKTSTYCCIHSRAMAMKTKTQTHALVVKKLSDAQLRDFSNQLSAVVIANAQAGTAT